MDALQIRQAATLVLFRDSAGGEPPRLLMLERSRAMRFAAGAIVFPGGAIEDQDTALARSFDHGLELDEAAARIAAARETLEESGILAGLREPVTARNARDVRQRLVAGEPFGDVLDASGLTLDLDQFVPFARWQPTPKEGAIARIFDTRFYIHRLTDDEVEATVDATENVRLFWASAADVLGMVDRKEARAIFPTRRNLERLALFVNFAAAKAQADAIPVEKISTWIEKRDGRDHLCIPDHLGYPVCSEPMDTVQRG